ncbi:MAG TPA: hypothetical protein VLZ83_05465 [Edaphocola sp.]|nr:hypothetical protein [Edaphocola sp.]
MKKILIEYNENEHQAFLKAINSAQGKVQTFINELQEIGSFTIETGDLSNLIIGDGETAANAIESNITHDLNRAGIRSKGILKAAIKEDLESYYSIRNEKRPLSINNEQLDYLVLKDGIISINDDKVKDLKEKFCIYITTEKGKQLFDIQSEIVKKVNEFLELANPNYINKMNVGGNLFGWNPENKQVSKNLLGYDRLAAE